MKLKTLDLRTDAFVVEYTVHTVWFCLVWPTNSSYLHMHHAGTQCVCVVLYQVISVFGLWWWAVPVGPSSSNGYTHHD